jgi:hypothetical protein
MVREQLVRWGLSSVVHQIETRSTRVAYFACTSLGRMPDATAGAFEGRYVVDPILWILGATDRFFAAERHRNAA